MTFISRGADVSRAQLDVDPYPVFRALREREPVVWAPQLGQWLVTSRELGMEVLRDPERFRTDEASSPIRDTFGAQMLSTEGDEQRRFKLACASPFNARAVDESRAMVEEIVRDAVDALPRSGAVELRSAYAAPIALTTIARVIGLPAELDVQLRAWYDTFAAALANYERVAETRTRAHAAVRAFHDAIAPRLAAPAAADQSLLAGLARAHPRMLDDGEIGANALIVLFGGIETTEGLIANALWALLTHPDILARVRDSDADLERAIEESLRWEPAVQTATRYAAADLDFHGARIARGAVVQCMLGAMNRDPGHVADPDRFDPWRTDPVAHTAFGFGRHYCLGAALARLEARTAVRAALERYPLLALDLARTRPPAGHEFRKVEALQVTLRGPSPHLGE